MSDVILKARYDECRVHVEELLAERQKLVQTIAELQQDVFRAHATIRERDAEIERLLGQRQDPDVAETV